MLENRKAYLMNEKFASVIGSKQPEAANIVIFGATGDLTKRKLLPALAHMHRWNLLGPHSRIIGMVRENFSQSTWKNYVHDALLQFFPDAVLNPRSWMRIKDKLDVVVGDLADPELYQKLARTLREADGRKNALFYLAIPPSWYETVASNLRDAGLADENEGFRRIVIEKPFGMDLASAEVLNQSLQAHFDETQIYRIDHYLGKEAVQNLMVFRFGNSVLEPLWNRNYIDHVQISVAESLGIEYRAGYYEKAGALRDMIQSHLIQVMSIVAMEPPLSMGADDVRNEKVKVMRAIRRMHPDDVHSHAVRAQYGAGTVDGEQVPAYREEQGVADDSATETFAAVKLYIDNWRWQGVPFLLRTGKRLPQRVSEICIRFKSPPQTLFDLDDATMHNNELIFRLQPDAGMLLTMIAKQPGLSMDLRSIQLDAPYAMAGSSMPEAYETLLHDVLIGEAGLFTRADGVEECWRVVEPIMEAWAGEKSINTYPAGSFDIPGIDALMEECEGGWRDLSDIEHAYSRTP
ncbi:MAG: glucose-6-phosphate dehydrogenase [Zetaproteobacteria bacterium]|nr:MAG: glucose-6-phosphate dehydrogenase [Zetaproteobacteria bacterium]